MNRLKLCSWNVNGIRAVTKKGFFTWLKNSDYDLVCLQETKADKEQIIETLEEENLAEVFPIAHFNSAERKGYSGVASFYRERFKVDEIIDGFRLDLAKPICEKIKLDSNFIKAFNAEGRVICSHHKALNLAIFNIYFPNGGANEERYKFKLKFYDFLLEYLKVYENEEKFSRIQVVFNI